MALQRALRLRKSSDFQRVRQQGRFVASRLLILAYMPNDLDALRIGFVVSKRISKRAVERNYIKRVLSEAIRPIIADMPAGWDLVLSAKNQVVGVPLSVLVQDIALLVRRAHLLASTLTSGPE
ncbi:MAG TPA: ribonuclease P protein component [Ktedonobacteraceae bacterium]|nr:ribonuclease P protein component [Ktedonobacteraceae bacterium]